LPNAVFMKPSILSTTSLFTSPSIRISSLFERVSSRMLSPLAARPSGTEDIYKIYAESFSGADHLRRILDEAQTIVGDALATAPEKAPGGTTAGTKP
jgi:hypothetical protein